MTWVLLWNVLAQVGSTTVAGEDVVKSSGPSGAFQLAAWIGPLVVIAAIIYLALRGFRRVGSAR